DPEDHGRAQRRCLKGAADAAPDRRQPRRHHPRRGQDLWRWNQCRRAARTARRARRHLHFRAGPPYGPFENCREAIDIAYKLGREADDANNKSRFLIYQNLKLMTHVYAWHGEIDRSVQQAEAAVAMSPHDAGAAQIGFIPRQCWPSGRRRPARDPRLKAPRGSPAPRQFEGASQSASGEPVSSAAQIGFGNDFVELGPAGSGCPYMRIDTMNLGCTRRSVRSDGIVQAAIS